MLLRRIIEHVKAQNWTAVALDFVIVVVGVFIGLQVSNWNGERQRRAQEQDYLTRLGNEIHLAAPSLQRRFAEKTEIADDLRNVVGYFHGLTENQELTSAHCRAIQHSHRYSDPEADLPVVSELIATGNLELIRDKKIRSSITALLLAQEQRVDILRDIQSQRAVLSSDFPDLIAFSTHPDDIDSEGDLGHECDFESMRGNQHFKNKLLDNISRNSAYMSFWNAEMDALDELHRLSDQTTGFEHPKPGETP